MTVLPLQGATALTAQAKIAVTATSQARPRNITMATNEAGGWPAGRAPARQSRRSEGRTLPIK